MKALNTNMGLRLLKKYISGVCLAENETQLKINTISHNRRGGDGSSSYGIFHINSRYWCKSSLGPSDGNGCNIDCDSK